MSTATGSPKEGTALPGFETPGVYQEELYVVPVDPASLTDTDCCQ